MKKITTFLILALTLLFTSVWAIGPMDSVLTRINKSGTTTTLNTAIAATVAVGSCTAVDMKNFDSAVLEIILLTGTSGISVQPVVQSSTTGTYVTPYTIAPGGATGANTWTAYPACTVTTASKSFILTNLKGRYWKFVPTLTGATTCTIKITPGP
jgi:hypothetical protein